MKRLLLIGQMDLRCLAVYRMSLGCLILADLLLRSGSILAHYTDHGMLPRSAAIQLENGPYTFSLLLASGELWLVVLHFFIQACLAFLLILGFKTRVVLLASWVLLLSLQMRNSIILQGEDVLIRLMLFWGLFLPLGERYSLDAKLKKSSNPEAETWSNAFVSVASFAYLVQIFWVYFAAGIQKTHSSWSDGSAVWLSLKNDFFSSALGRSFCDLYPSLVEALPLWVVWSERLLPFLLFVPFLWRASRLIVLLAFCSMHIAFLLLMNIGLFPWISLACWIPLFPLSGLRQDASIPSDPQSTQAQPMKTKWPVQLLAAAVLLLVIGWNCKRLFQTPFPKALTPLVYAPRLDQTWSMFRGGPIDSGWISVKGILANGNEIDFLQRGAPYTEEKPANVYQTFPIPRHRWSKFLFNMKSGTREKYLTNWASYMHREWNHRLGHKGTSFELETYDVVYHRERLTHQDIPMLRKDILLWRHYSDTSYAPKYKEIHKIEDQIRAAKNREWDPSLAPKPESGEGPSPEADALEGNEGATDQGAIDHAAIDYAAIDHDAIDHAAIDHAAIDHAVIDHAAINHAVIDHAAIDHAVIDHAAIDHAVIDHAAIDHDAIETKASGN